MMTMQESRQVLIVDDEPDIRRFLALSLEMSGFEVTVAEDGIQADALVRETMPHLVVLDVMMPGVDGISVLRKLRSHPLTQAIPVVMLTAKSSDEDTWAGWEAGANYYMTKPFDIDHLIEVLELLSNPDDGFEDA